MFHVAEIIGQDPKLLLNEQTALGGHTPTCPSPMPHALIPDSSSTLGTDEGSSIARGGSQCYILQAAHPPPLWSHSRPLGGTPISNVPPNGAFEWLQRGRGGAACKMQHCKPPQTTLQDPGKGQGMVWVRGEWGNSLAQALKLLSSWHQAPTWWMANITNHR